MSSSTMAKKRPTFSRVASQKALPPDALKRKETTGAPWSKASCASVRSSPDTMTRSSTASFCARPLASASVSRIEAPAGSGSTPARTVSSTMRKLILAVVPMISGSSFSPGSWIRMRASPCRWIEGSLVPSGSMRRRRISIACSTTWSCRSSTKTSLCSRRKVPSPLSLTVTSVPSSSRSSPATSAALVGSRSVKVTPPSRTPRLAKPTLASRSA